MTEKKWIKPSEGMPPYRDGMHYWVVSKVHGLLPTPESHSQLFDHYQAADLEAYALIDPPPPLPKVYADGEWRPMSEPVPLHVADVVAVGKSGAQYIERSDYFMSRTYLYTAWQPVPACLRVVPEWVKECGNE